MRSGKFSVEWPWRRRSNPPVDALDLRPVWLPLRRDRVWNATIRDACKGAAGVYAIRQRGGGRTVLYVGESHEGPTGSKGYESDRRFWQTIKRHFFSWSLEAEWVHLADADLDVALWLVAPADARTVEERVIADLEPLHASGHFTAEAPDGVPF